MIQRVLEVVQGGISLVVIGFVLLMASSFLPVSSPIKVFTVQSGSMEPSIKTGSLIFVRAAGEYEVGDVLTFLTGDSEKSVTHRVVEKKNSEIGPMFLTKGDSNEEADPREIAASQVIGKTLFSLPYLGYPVAYAKTQKGFLLMIVLPALLIIIGEIATIIGEVRSIVRKRRKKKVIPERYIENLTFVTPISFEPPIYRSTWPTPPPRRRKIV